MVLSPIEITLNETEKKLNIRKRDLLKSTRKNPLTLLRQNELSKFVGSGNVQREFKRINLIKKQSRQTGLRQIAKLQRDINLERLDIIESQKIKLDIIPI